MLTSALMYIASQFIKMMLIATFVEVERSPEFDLTHDLMRSSISFVDVFGMSVCLIYDFFGRSKHLSPDTRILGCSLGWVLGESVIQRFVPLWVSARKTEFLWENILMSAEANVNIILYLSFMTMVWVFSRRDLPSTTKYFVVFAGMICMFYPSIIGVLSTLLNEFEVLGARAGLSLSLFFTSHVLKKHYDDFRTKTK